MSETVTTAILPTAWMATSGEVDNLMDEVDRVRRVYGNYARDRQDRWASDYAIHDERARLLRQTLAAATGGSATGGDLQVLDLGCGQGDLHDDLVSSGVRPDRIAGVDLIPDRLVQARERGLSVALASGSALPFKAGSFDLAVAFTVLSSIHDASVLAGIEANLKRVLKPGGALIVYDMRLPSPSNRSIRPITLRRLDQLFPGWFRASRSCTLLPPLARRVAPNPGGRYDALARVPILRSHTISVLRPPSTDDQRASRPR